MHYTPRQAAAFMSLARSEQDKEGAFYLGLTATAMHGSKEQINKRIRELSK
jgi:hypothetical protein